MKKEVKMVNIKIKKKSMFLSTLFLLILILVCLQVVFAIPTLNPSEIYGPNGQIAQVSEDGTLIYAGDGTEFLILNDSNGNIIYKEVVDDSGNVIKEEGKEPDSLKRKIDKETGLYYYAYDSTTRTYLQATGIMFKEMATGIGALFAEMARSSSPYAGLHTAMDPNAVTQYEPRIALTSDMIPVYGQIKTIATPMPNENLLNRFLIKGGAVSSLTSTFLFATAGGLSAAGYNPVVWSGASLNPQSSFQYAALKNQLALQEAGLSSGAAARFVTNKMINTGRISFIGHPLYHLTNKGGFEGITSNKLIWGSDPPLSGDASIHTGHGYVHLTDISKIKSPEDLWKVMVVPKELLGSPELKSVEDFSHIVTLMTPEYLVERSAIIAFTGEEIYPNIFRIPCAIGRKGTDLGVHLTKVKSGVYLIDCIDEFRQPISPVKISNGAQWFNLAERDIYP